MTRRAIDVLAEHYEAVSELAGAMSAQDAETWRSRVSGAKRHQARLLAEAAALPHPPMELARWALSELSERLHDDADAAGNLSATLAESLSSINRRLHELAERGE